MATSTYPPPPPPPSTLLNEFTNRDTEGTLDKKEIHSIGTQVGDGPDSTNPAQYGQRNDYDHISTRSQNLLKHTTTSAKQVPKITLPGHVIINTISQFMTHNTRKTPAHKPQYRTWKRERKNRNYARQERNRTTNILQDTRPFYKFWYSSGRNQLKHNS